MQDLNLRPPAPKAGALPNCANSRIDGASVIHLKDVTGTCPLFAPSEREGEQKHYSKNPGVLNRGYTSFPLNCR